MVAEQHEVGLLQHTGLFGSQRQLTKPRVCLRDAVAYMLIEQARAVTITIDVRRMDHQQFRGVFAQDIAGATQGKIIAHGMLAFYRHRSVAANDVQHIWRGASPAKSIL